MIENFKDRRLKRLYERGDRSKIRADLVDKVERILARLDQALVIVCQFTVTMRQQFTD